MLGLGFSLTQTVLRNPGWTPARLFGAGAVGFALNPGVLASLAQDAAGTQPVTVAGQPVGLARDQSGGASHASQAVSAARPTYRLDAGGRPYLEFDGVDDWLTTASLALAAGGRTIIAALRKRSDAGVSSILETRPLWTAAAGGFAQFAPSSPGPANYGSRALTSAASSSVNTPTSYAAPHVAVLSSVVVAGSHVARVNGAQVASDAPAGTIPALTAAVGIGSRDGSSFFAGIDLYGLIVIDRGLSGAELTQAEAWAAARCGVAL